MSDTPEQLPGPGETWIAVNRQHRVVKLSAPVRDGEKTLTELTIRQPCMLDIWTIPAPAMERPLEILGYVLARAAGVSDTAVRMLSIGDAVACTRALLEMGFTIADAYSLLDPQAALSLQTGQTGSA
jgi:hypothetical protein